MTKSVENEPRDESSMIQVDDGDSVLLKLNGGSSISVISKGGEDYLSVRNDSSAEIWTLTRSKEKGTKISLNSSGDQRRAYGMMVIDSNGDGFPDTLVGDKSLLAEYAIFLNLEHWHLEEKGDVARLRKMETE